MDTAVHVRGLAKRYGALEAVRGIDLDIHRGETFALLGPNGAGKSTTIEILEGLRKRDGGEVSVLGADPHRPTRAWRARVGIVPQTAGDVAEVSVREIVTHFARFYPAPADPDEVIDRVGLAEKAKARVAKLSGGQRRRLDVALGLIGNPELLFLDEPTTGFDPEARRRFWELIRSLEATTILLTTHYLDEAEELADRVAVIAGGRIVAEGTPRTLGGRASDEATVTWADGQERTDTPTKTIAELMTRYDGEIPELRVTRPTLEDVYLRLVEES
ncbi:ABC transporter ATP-binding protein [Nonomuraea endophytica]|uniref:ABC-2 type transport system ATP-binding protein n=1 Tax=Nonomuraea endophytica TaxID=714136 RepID=A0A7W8A5I3_9ACTN|nr:ABC transporter ATP-binding protein [Nonomuraea endophytica]MBB5079920.1 ABC-2 type transport system ATP-binding protein [Nonomuraea endophytica]